MEQVVTMASGDRFYLLKAGDRHALWGDVGSVIRLDGIAVSSGGDRAVLLLPDVLERWNMNVPALVEPTLEQWSEWLRRSDNPEVLVGPLQKAWHRKCLYDISGVTQQKIWAADGFKCMYCGRLMGQVAMTVDHFIPLEMGGANHEKNFISACRRCNKQKGNQDPATFLASGFCGYMWSPYGSIVDQVQAIRKYLEERKLP